MLNPAKFDKIQTLRVMSHLRRSRRLQGKPVGILQETPGGTFTYRSNHIAKTHDSTGFGRGDQR